MDLIWNSCHGLLVHGTDLWSHVVRCTTEGVSCLVQVELKLAHAKVYHPEYNTFSKMTKFNYIHSKWTLSKKFLKSTLFYFGLWNKKGKALGVLMRMCVAKHTQEEHGLNFECRVSLLTFLKDKTHRKQCKMSSSKKIDLWKDTRHVFICLGPRTPYLPPVTHCIHVYRIFIHTGTRGRGGDWARAFTGQFVLMTTFCLGTYLVN